MEFERLVAYFDADVSPLKKKTDTATKLIDNLEKRIKNFKGKLDLTTGNKSSGSGSIDAQMRKAEADIRRFQAERTRGEQAFTRTVEREARQQSAARTREQRRSSNAFLAELNKVNAAEKKQRSGASRFGGGSALIGGIVGGGAAGALIGVTGTLTSMATEGRDAYLSLEKLVRFTSTLDRSFQTTDGLQKFRKDIESLSREIPQSAENIAKASFTVKSAYSKMTEPELISFLRKLGVQATASNTTIDLHADRVAAMAKMYKITAGELDTFGALISTSFGDALATDSQVGDGFNKILVSARSVKQPLNEVAAAMGAIQSTSSDAEKNTTNLQNVFAKLGDPKYIQGLKEVFNIDVFDAQGGYKGLNAIVNELSKSLDGLTDKEKSAKIGEVFKDLQAREGLLSLVDVLGQYNDRLRDGADQDAWAQKQTTMLNSADSKWQMLTNRVDEYKRKLGEGITDPITAAAGSQTTGGGIGLFFTEATHSLQKGYTAILRTMAEGGTKISTELDQSLGLKTATEAAKVNQNVSEYFDGVEKVWLVNAEKTKLSILEGQKKFFDDIAGDGNASDAMRDDARKKAEALAASITETKAVISKAYAEIVTTDGSKQAADQATSIGQYVALALRGGFVGAMSDTGESQAAVQNLVNSAQASSAGPAQTSGASLGQSFVSGMVNAIRAGGGSIGSAVASLVERAFSSGQAAQDSHSPSRRAAKELGIPFVQGIETGIAQRAGSLENATASMIKGSMFGPKSKKAAKENLKQIFNDLTYALGRIDPASGAAKQALERQFAAILGDQSTSFDAQIASISDYFQQIYDIEEGAYQKRLANIAQREDAIRRRKDLKPQERTDALRAIGDERTDVTNGRDQARYDLGRQLGSSLSGAGDRRVEMAERDFIRQQMLSEIALIGVRRTAEAEASTNTANELARIQRRIDAYTDERANYEVGSVEYVEWNNKIIDAEQDSADAVAKGSADKARARQEDQQALADYVRSLADYSRQTAESQFEAEQTKIDLLRSTGAKQEEVFAAEQSLGIKRERFQTSIRVAEIAGNRDSLLQLATTEEQKLQIRADANAQMESEAVRHQTVMAQILASNGERSILGQWKAMAAQLPGYGQQFKEFAVGLPETIAGVFASATQQMDGTWDGFLDGMKTAFFQAVQAMFAELARVQLIKGLVGLFGAIAGSFGGGASAGTDITGGIGVMNGYADGGVPPMNRVSMVGENGPELFVPNVAGRVLSNEDSKAAIAGRGRGGDTINNLSVTQVFKGPRGLIAPKSTRQQTEAAVTGLSYGTKGR